MLTWSADISAASTELPLMQDTNNHSPWAVLPAVRRGSASSLHSKHLACTNVSEIFVIVIARPWNSEPAKTQRRHLFACGERIFFSTSKIPLKTLLFVPAASTTINQWSKESHFLMSCKTCLLRLQSKKIHKCASKIYTPRGCT